MKVTLKYAIPRETAEVLLPIGCEIVSMAVEQTSLFIWVIADRKATTEVRRFKIIQTGIDIPEGFVYVRTYHVGQGVDLHLFEDISKCLDTSAKKGICSHTEHISGHLVAPTAEREWIDGYEKPTIDAEGICTQCKRCVG